MKSYGDKIRDLGGVKAPRYGECETVIKEAKKSSSGVVGNKGIAKGGLPKRGK